MWHDPNLPDPLFFGPITARVEEAKRQRKCSGEECPAKGVIPRGDHCVVIQVDWKDGSFPTKNNFCLKCYSGVLSELTAAPTRFKARVRDWARRGKLKYSSP